jgi:G3E family GTPase
LNIIVFGGFLGSGKTTVLMQLARYLTRCPSEKETPVVIIENEISENGVDNQLLSRENFTVANLFSGCICCTSNAQLCGTITSLQEKYSPDWILVEATGLAYPDSIVSTIKNGLNFCAEVLAIVDVKRWQKVLLALNDFITAQLSCASVVLLTKT